MKQQVRCELLETRLHLTSAVLEAASARICREILAWLSKRPTPPRKLFLYAAVKNEISVMLLADWAWRSGVEVALPVIVGPGRMEFHVWHQGDDLETNRWGIPEPQHTDTQVIPTDDTLVVMPALSLDHQGYRLGFGGGFYDRYLERFPGVECLGVIPAAFFRSLLPHDSHDKRVNWIATEDGILRALP